MAKLNISQASKKWGVARSTLRRAIQNGHLTATTGKNQWKYIDSSEMVRVYGGANGVNGAPKSEVSATLVSVDPLFLERLKIHYHYTKKENINLVKELEKKDKLIESQRDMLMIMHRQLPLKSNNK